MEASTDGNASQRMSLWKLTTVLFLSYLCVAIPLPVISVFVTKTLGFNNVWAGLGVGIAFLSTILTRGFAGNLSDRRGAKVAVGRGLAFYAAGAVVTLIAGLGMLPPSISYLVLVLGRLAIGLGESLVGVGIISWGIGIVGPPQTGRVLALVGAAIYGALAVGGPIGVALFDRLGFSGAMAISAVLPCLGLIGIAGIAGVAPHTGGKRPSFVSVIGRILPQGLIVCLQGVGFAAIGSFFVLYFLRQHWANAGLGFSAFGGGFVLVRILFGHLPDRYGGLRVAIVSLAVETVGQMMIWSAHDPALALVGAFLTGLGCSMIFPAMGREVVHLVAPNQRGAALGGFTAFQDLAYGATGPVAGLLADRAGYGSVFLIGGCASGIGFVIALVLRHRSSASRPPAVV